MPGTGTERSTPRKTQSSDVRTVGTFRMDSVRRIASSLRMRYEGPELWRKSYLRGIAPEVCGLAGRRGTDGSYSGKLRLPTPSESKRSRTNSAMATPDLREVPTARSAYHLDRRDRTERSIPATPSGITQFHRYRTCDSYGRVRGAGTYHLVRWGSVEAGIAFPFSSP